MIITEEILACVERKNKRARQRMARRYARKAERRRKAENPTNWINERYTELEIRLHRLTKLPSARARRDRKKLDIKIDKEIKERRLHILSLFPEVERYE